MNIFIGTHENCGIIAELSKGFLELGHNVTSLVKSRDKFFTNYKYSFEEIYHHPHSIIGKIINRVAPIERVLYNKKLKERFQSILNNDLYIYTWDSILPNLSDVFYLKKNNKKIVFLFIGSDVRYAKAFQQEFNDIQIPWPDFQWNEALDKKISFIRNIELSVDCIYSLPDQAGLQIRPYSHLFLPFEAKTLDFNYPDHEIPIIVHAPSNTRLKGTDLILSALKELESEGLKFELILIQNKNNAEVKKALKDADIVIDQIYLHGPGMFGLEAMASGCALATRYFKEYYSIFNPPACYIDNTNTLKSNLRKLITDRAYRKDLAFQGRKFVEYFNNPKRISKEIIDNISKEEYNYDPDFFIKTFELEGQTLSASSKKLNEIAIKKFEKDNVDWNFLRKRGLI